MSGVVEPPGTTALSVRGIDRPVIAAPAWVASASRAWYRRGGA